MSFNRLNYDTCTYKQILAESISPGDYLVNTPKIACEPCYQSNPSIRLQNIGNSISKTQYLIDIDSELIGITRKNSNCPSKKYIAECKNCKCLSGEPCGQGVTTLCEECTKELKNGKRCGDEDLYDYKDCHFMTDESRLSNPPCNLRGTGWNRWEWLCLNPQERVEIPFDWNINNRLVVKDNHRPCIPKPIDVERSLPTPGSIPCDMITPTCSSYTLEPSTDWRNCNEIRNN
jgi:hypothetical protein